MQLTNHRNISHRFGRSHRSPKRKKRSSHGVDKSYAAKFAAEPNVNFLTGQRFFGRNRRSFFGIWPRGKKAKCGPKKGQNRGYDTIICDNLDNLPETQKSPGNAVFPRLSGFFQTSIVEKVTFSSALRTFPKKNTLYERIIIPNQHRIGCLIVVLSPEEIF